METKKLYVLVFLLMLLVVDEYMMRSEARTCYTKSTKFTGWCFWKRDASACKAACKYKRYSGGVCKRLSCNCWNKCASVPGGGATPTHTQPPPQEINNEEGPGGDYN
ncbi:hypothetical protein CASFOL_026780 [Castilleja foliolosa]|uniref:Invertebrate defensins family profile domain-containing protein n=1 Tax=Castilleja foliolosa TaxID=1961234 RepID=A0ABD3CI10_9LAMI